MHLSFHATGAETLPPDDDKAADIFARLGYKITDAIADLVDNSVDAAASAVHVRFVRTSGGVDSLLIADNGSGMTDQELREAMRFGSQSVKDEHRLGKYGIGLKSASLSQADTVTVLTRVRSGVHGRRWTRENIKNNWSCEILDPKDVTLALKASFGEWSIGGGTGTLVLWQRLQHLHALGPAAERVLIRTRRELMTELGIRFHRYLSDGRLSISIDEQHGIDEPTGVVTFVSPLDPFSYPASGNADYPIELLLPIGGQEVRAECHIWPPKSNQQGYRLGGGKVALRQGFYFYRNDRVIQAGGWNRLIEDDGEPHLSLARVKVDLPAQLDRVFKLDVTKSRLDPTPEFAQALMAARTRDGRSFSDYKQAAQLTYRKQKAREGARFPLIPGKGFRAETQEAIAEHLAEKGTGRPKKVKFVWERLDPTEMFRIDADKDILMLNSRYRSELKEGGGTDAPVLKLALMFLLQAHMEKAFATKTAKAWINKVNLALIAAMKG